MLDSRTRTGLRLILIWANSVPESLSSTVFYKTGFTLFDSFGQPVKHCPTLFCKAELDDDSRCFTRLDGALRWSQLNARNLSIRVRAPSLVPFRSCRMLFVECRGLQCMVTNHVIQTFYKWVQHTRILAKNDSISDLSKRGRQRQRREARKMFLRNPRILLSISLLSIVYPVCFYFRCYSVDSSVS